MLDLEDFVGAVLDDVGDGVAVRGAEEEGLQDEEVEGSLKEVGFEGGCGALGHCGSVLQKII